LYARVILYILYILYIFSKIKASKESTYSYCIVYTREECNRLKINKMRNTRIITITRPKWIEDKKNPGQLKKVYVDYPVRINRAVTDSHRMCENW
jgi:hypothetical protein